jgi:hypothetical protein
MIPPRLEVTPRAILAEMTNRRQGQIGKSQGNRIWSALKERSFNRAEIEAGMAPASAIGAHRKLQNFQHMLCLP